MDSTFWNLRHSETGRQLIMFPFLGGFGASYNRLISDLEGDWDIWTANPPGHGPSLVPPLTDLVSLRTHYLDALRDILKPDAVFFGLLRPTSPSGDGQGRPGRHRSRTPSRFLRSHSR